MGPSLGARRAAPILPLSPVISATPRPTDPPRFVGFPSTSLLESGRLPLAELATLACREGQATSPLFRVHRWFARRLSSQFRGILSGLTLPARAEKQFWARFFGEVPLGDAVVLDPFVGGGTTVAEASRGGARVIGYDIDPVAAAITRLELGLADLAGLPAAAEEVTAPIAAQLAPFHTTRLPDGREATVLHHFWVEVKRCDRCQHEVELHPHFRLAFDAAKDLQWVFCRRCHEVHERPHGATAFVCGCGTRTVIEAAPVREGVMHCPACRGQRELSADRRPGDVPQWRLFAQEYLEGDGLKPRRLFKRATDADRARAQEAADRLAQEEAVGGAFAPHREIPADGRKDRRPLLYGFRAYRDLFNPRQLLHLTLLGRAIRAIDDRAVRQVLGLAFSEHLTTNCMYTAYAFGYRRTSALFSIHGFRHITRPVELNPWLFRVGRGTFPNALDKIRRAITFAQSPSDLDPEGGRRASLQRIGVTGPVAHQAEEVFAGRARAAIVAQSSVALRTLPRGSVDLVLTDPPYFDNISYSELSDFYLAWHQVLGIAPAPYDDAARSTPMLESLAIASRSEDAVRRYRTELSEIFRACGRVLAPSGACVFTYHHESPVAWAAVGAALAHSGLRCTAVVPMRGEGQGGLHSYEGTIKWDAVLVCRRSDAAAIEGDGAEPPALGEVVVTAEARATALRRVRAYTRSLGGDPRIGFRRPDAQNLYRALLAAAAVPAGPDARPAATVGAGARPRRRAGHEGHMPLELALSTGLVSDLIP